MGWRLTAAFFALAFTSVQAQSDDLSPGKFLVASRDLGDPNFAETVVLLLQYDEEHGAMGLVINRASDVPLSDVFKDLKEVKSRTDPVYIGGPVELSKVFGLLKSTAVPDDSKKVFGSVYLINTKEQFQKTLAAGVTADAFHVYVGYAGWGRNQLEHEVELGAWHIFPADAGNVFSPNPEAVWQRLIRRTESQIASARYSARNVSSGSTSVARRAGK
jgi:putative transcriptional regulator